MKYWKIIARAGLLMLALGLGGCLQMFGNNHGGGVGVNIELPKLIDDTRSDNPSATHPAGRL